MEYGSSSESPRKAEPEFHVGARLKQGHQGRNCQAGVRTSLQAPCPVLFPLSQEISPITCYFSLSPYQGMLALVRSRIRGQKTEAFIGTADVLPSMGMWTVQMVKIQENR